MCQSLVSVKCVSECNVIETCVSNRMISTMSCDCHMYMYMYMYIQHTWRPVLADMQWVTLTLVNLLCQCGSLITVGNRKCVVLSRPHQREWYSVN